VTDFEAMPEGYEASSVPFAGRDRFMSSIIFRIRPQ